MKLFYLLALPVLVSASSIENGTVSSYAVHMPTGKVLADENSNKSLVPSSCMKFITTAAAFQLLGAKSTFKTALSYDGYIDEEGTLHGNLYVVGGGDPCLGSSRIKGSLGAKEVMDFFTSKVKEKGILEIKGKVIGDASKWEEELAGPGWLFEDLGNYYGAGASGLSFHENKYLLTFRPGEKEGDATEVLGVEPKIERLSLKNSVTTGAIGSGDRAVIYGSETSFSQVVRGTIPMGVEKFSISGAMPDPSFIVEDLLTSTLKEEGIPVLGEEVARSEVEEITEITSPSIGDIIYETNQKSINLYAEHLLKAMGKGKRVDGIAAVRGYLRSLNLELDGFHMDDGSGLSRKNLVTTKLLVSLLQRVKEAECFPDMLRSLPLQKGEIRAKSGTMSFMGGYVGYAGDIAFAILINNCSSRKEINEKIESFYDELVR